MVSLYFLYFCLIEGSPWGGDKEVQEALLSAWREGATGRRGGRVRGLKPGILEVLTAGQLIEAKCEGLGVARGSRGNQVGTEEGQKPWGVNWW